MSACSTAERSPIFVAFGGLIAMAVGIGIGRFVYTPILPPMLAALGLSKSTAGLIASANFAGYLAGALGATRAALPGSRRAWLLGALLTSAVTTASMGLTTSLAGFLVLRFLGGVVSALALILASALVLDRLAEAGRPGLMALHFAGVGVGIAVSAALVATQLADGVGWAAMWQASGAVSLLGTLAVAVLVPAGRDPTAPVRASRGTVRDPRLRRITLAYGLFGFGYVITATFLVAIVRAAPAIRALEPVGTTHWHSGCLRDRGPGRGGGCAGQRGLAERHRDMPGGTAGGGHLRGADRAGPGAWAGVGARGCCPGGANSSRSAPRDSGDDWGIWRRPDRWADAGRGAFGRTGRVRGALDDRGRGSGGRGLAGAAVARAPGDRKGSASVTGLDYISGSTATICRDHHDEEPRAPHSPDAPADRHRARQG